MVFLYTIIICTSTALSVDTNLSLQGGEKRLEGFPVLVCYASLFFFSFRYISTNKLDLVIRLITYCSALVALYGILQHFQLDFLPRNSKKLDWTRSYAFFDNPNFFGSYLVLMILPATALYLSSKKKIYQILHLGIISILFIALIYSITRSAWLGTFCGFIFLSFFVIWKRRYLWKRWLLLLVILASLFILINKFENNSYLTRANTIISDADSVLSGENTGDAGSSRWYIWKKSLPLVKEYFWFGSGPDTFAVVFPNNPEEKQKYFNNPDIKVDKAHNEYLQIAVTLGVPALIVYLIFISHILISGLKAARRQSGDLQIYTYGLLAAIVGYLIQAFFNISVVPVAPFFWIFLGMLYRIANPLLAEENGVEK